MLYPTPDDARRVADQANLRTSFIDFSGAASTIWHRVIREAERQRRLDQLVACVRQEYPESTVVAEVYGYLKWVTPPSGARTPGPALEDGGGASTELARLNEKFDRAHELMTGMDHRLQRQEIKMEHIESLLPRRSGDDPFSKSQWMLVTIGVVFAIALLLLVLTVILRAA